MVERLRNDLDGLEVAAAAVAEATGIPAAHVEKDFWLTEALRGVVRAAEALGVPVYFKGGTSLSKVFGLIRRFSEDVDILAVLRNDDSAGARHKVLKALCAGATEATGLEEHPVGDKSSKGEKRAVTLRYSTRQALQPLRHEGVLVEIGHWGGTYPHERHAVRSLIAEHGPALDIDGPGQPPVGRGTSSELRRVLRCCPPVPVRSVTYDDRARAGVGRGIRIGSIPGRVVSKA